MTRVKKAVHALKYRRSLLRETKGYRFARSKKERAASEAFLHAHAYAFAHRKRRKKEFRQWWNILIGGALRAQDISYSKFMGALKKKGVALDRKILSLLVREHPDSFKRIVEYTNS